jgi:hypothetical protein
LKRFIVTIIGTTAIFGGLLSAAAAAGATTASSGPIKVWVTPSPTGTGVKHPGKVLLTGAIGDYGKSYKANASGKPDKKGTYEELKLRKGTILVDVGPLNKAFNAAFSAPLFNPKNCSISADATAAITIVRGTRAYAGVTGNVTMAAKFGGVLPKTHGKRSKCTTKTSTPPLTTYSSIIGSGTVTLP